MLTFQEQILLLQRLPETGAGTYWRLLEEFPDLDGAFAASSARLSQILKPVAFEAFWDFRQNGKQSAIFRRVSTDIAWCHDHNIKLVDVTSSDYPAILSDIKRAPPLLYVRGDSTALSMPQIAVVGSRNPSAGGNSNASNFAQALAASGLTITSGLALGIDTAAHRGALLGGGKTIAVLGTGIDQMYPRKNHKLAQEIVESGGAIVSEFPLGVGPLPGNFPQRNRIISGLSSGVLVVEAAVKSGSLITARYAIQHNREVFAIPGSIHNPLSKGGHALIKEGAKLVETAQDIVDELQGYLSFKWSEVSSELRRPKSIEVDESVDSQEHAVLKQLGYDPVSFDVLMQRLDVEPGELTALLMTMEFKGLLEPVGRGYVRAST